MRKLPGMENIPWDDKNMVKLTFLNDSPTHTHTHAFNKTHLSLICAWINATENKKKL